MAVVYKTNVLFADNHGHDLGNGQSLRYKQKEVALKDQMSTLELEVNYAHDAHSKHVANKLTNATLDQLTARAKKQQEKFNSIYMLHCFLADYHNLASWINEMKIKILTDGAANDIDSTKALLQRHRIYKDEIDAHEDKFKNTAEVANQLLEEMHCIYEIEEKLQQLFLNKNSLLALCESRCTFYEQYVDLKVLYSEIDQINAWMTDQEALLLPNKDFEYLDNSVEILVNKHEDFAKALAAKEQNIKFVDEFATKLLNGKHFAAQDIAQCRTEFLERYSILRKLLLDRCERDWDEIKKWVQERLESAIDKSYLDGISSKIKAQNCKDSRSGKEVVASMKQELIDSKDNATSHIQQAVNQILHLLETLVQITERKCLKLQKMNQQQNSSKVRLSGLTYQSEDSKKDVTFIKNLQDILGTIKSNPNEVDAKEQIDFNKGHERFDHLSNEINNKRSEIIDRASKLKISLVKKCCEVNESRTSNFSTDANTKQILYKSCIDIQVGDVFLNVDDHHGTTPAVQYTLNSKDLIFHQDLTNVRNDELCVNDQPSPSIDYDNNMPAILRSLNLFRYSSFEKGLVLYPNLYNIHRCN